MAEFARSPSVPGPARSANSPRLASRSATTRAIGIWAVAKLDRMILFPMPEATTRLTALRSGPVDWMKSRPGRRAKPEGCRLRNRHRQLSAHVAMGPQPRRRIAMTARARAAGDQLLLDREGLVCEQPGGAFDWRVRADRCPIRHPRGQYKHDPAKARRYWRRRVRSRQAGRGRVMISTSGSGQVLPLADE